jgi:hypothetical protein
MSVTKTENQKINPQDLRDKLNQQLIHDKLENLDSLAQDLETFYCQEGATEFESFYEGWFSLEYLKFKNIIDMINVIKIIPKDCQQLTKGILYHFITDFNFNIHNVAKSINDLFNLIETVPEQYRMAVVRKLLHLIKTTEDYALVLKKLPKTKYLKYIFTIDLQPFEKAQFIVEQKVQLDYLEQIVSYPKNPYAEHELALLILYQLPPEQRVEWVSKLKHKVDIKKSMEYLLPNIIPQCKSILKLIDAIPLDSRFDILFKLQSMEYRPPFEDYPFKFTFEQDCPTWAKACDNIIKEFLVNYLNKNPTLDKHMENQILIYITHIKSFLEKLQETEDTLRGNPHPKNIVAIFQSVSPDILKITPYFIRNDLFKNAQYFKQVARFCIFLKEKAPTQFDYLLNAEAICNAAKNSKNLDSILEISQLFIEKNQLTQENFELICICPEAAEIFLNAGSIPGGHHVSQSGWFSKIKATPVIRPVPDDNKIEEVNNIQLP